MTAEGTHQVSPAMLKDALALAGLTFPEEDQEALLRGINANLNRYAELQTNLEMQPQLSPAPTTSLIWSAIRTEAPRIASLLSLRISVADSSEWMTL